MAEPDSGTFRSLRPAEEDGLDDALQALRDLGLVDPPEERVDTFGPSRTVRTGDLTPRQAVDEGGATGGDDDGVWKLAAALSGAMAPFDVAAALAEEGAAAAAASFSNMALLDNLTNRVRLVHHPVMHESIAARWSEFELSEPTPLCEAMLTGRPVLLDSIEEVSRAFPNMAADTAAAHLSATASLPLSSASGVVLGAAGFGWPDTQEFGVDQVRRLDLIANLAAQALERALLYEAERAASVRRERADAQLIQDAFLPRAMPANSGLEVAAVYLPASDAAMGGDWYDVFPVDGGTCLVVGDVAGHGLQSAAVMAQLRNTVRAYAIEDPSPAQVLMRLNRMMCRLEPGEHASAIVAVWDQRGGTILRSSAGHPPMLRCRAGEFDYLTPPIGGLLLGVRSDWVYREEIKVLRPGTTVVFYTDGLVERRGQGIETGMSELLECVKGSTDLSPASLCDRILDWRDRSAPREDDVCLLAARLACEHGRRANLGG